MQVQGSSPAFGGPVDAENSLTLLVKHDFGCQLVDGPAPFKGGIELDEGIRPQSAYGQTLVHHRSARHR